MNTLIKITGRQLPIFNSAIVKEQEKLAAEIKRLRNQLAVKEQEYKENEFILKQLGLGQVHTAENETPNFFVIESNGAKTSTPRAAQVFAYSHDMSVWSKVKYFLGTENKVLTGREIIESIYNKQPELKNVPHDEKKKIEDGVFAILTKYTQSGDLIRFKKENEANYKYGFRQWFNAEKEIKKEYLV